MIPTKPVNIFPARSAKLIDIYFILMIYFVKTYSQFVEIKWISEFVPKAPCDQTKTVSLKGNSGHTLTCGTVHALWGLHWAIGKGRTGQDTTGEVHLNLKISIFLNRIFNQKKNSLKLINSKVESATQVVQDHEISKIS